MLAVLIICAVLALVFFIEVEFHLENTFWIHKKSNRPIIVIRYNAPDVIYKYAGESFERRMKLTELLTNFKYNGGE